MQRIINTNNPKACLNDTKIYHYLLRATVFKICGGLIQFLEDKFCPFSQRVGLVFYYFTTNVLTCFVINRHSAPQKWLIETFFLGNKHRKRKSINVN